MHQISIGEQEYERVYEMMLLRKNRILAEY